MYLRQGLSLLSRLECNDVIMISLFPAFDVFKYKLHWFFFGSFFCFVFWFGCSQATNLLLLPLYPDLIFSAPVYTLGVLFLFGFVFLLFISLLKVKKCARFNPYFTHLGLCCVNYSLSYLVNVSISPKFNFH